MKLLQYYKDLDHKMLNKYPVAWVLGVHLYIPLIIASSILLFAIGALVDLSPLPQWRDYREIFSTISMVLVLPTILLVILFIIRQVKFNSKRVHIRLPHGFSYPIFLYYIAVFACIIALPFMANIGATVRAGITLNTEQFKKDTYALDDGYRHFYMSKQYVDSSYLQEYGQDPDDNDYIDHRTTYRLTAGRDSLIFQRSKLTDQYIGRSYGMDTVLLSEVYAEIQSFIEVASRYGAEFSVTNPREIVEINIRSDKFYQNASAESTVAYEHISNSDTFSNTIRFHDEYIDRDGPFFITSIEFWQFYLLLALGLAVLVSVLCSVQIIDFGWAMLVTALTPTVYGIFIALIGLTTGDVGDGIILFFLTLFVLFYLWTAFASPWKYRLKRAFAITVHLYAPFVLMIYMFMLRSLSNCCSPNYSYNDCDCYHVLTNSQYEDLVYVCAVALTFVVQYLFARYYKKEYINPQQ